jgi:hypothetical protein
MDGAIAGGKNRRLQVSVPKERGWTKAKRAAFLDMLAATCNVKASAQHVGMHPVGAYRLRRRDPQFADLWRAAILTGYDRLEEMLLAHAGAGVNDVAIGETEIEPAPFDPKMAMELLRQHRPTVEGRRKRPTGRLERTDRATAEAALLKKLDALARRLRAEEAK